MQMDVYWDQKSIKQIVMTSSNGQVKVIGGTDSSSHLAGLKTDSIILKKENPLIGFYGFLSGDLSEIIGLGGLVDMCQANLFES